MKALAHLRCTWHLLQLCITGACFEGFRKAIPVDSSSVTAEERGIAERRLCVSDVAQYLQ
jgi:hypothetical protein